MPHARPGGARGRDRNRVLDAAHGVGAARRSRDHAGAARGPRRPGALDFFERAGVADRVDLRLGDARETIESVEGPIDLLFVDAAKDEYERYIELAEPKLSERAVLVVDNMLMSGEVALPEGAETRWRGESLTAARALNAELVDSDRWLACVLPVGDGIAFASRR